MDTQPEYPSPEDLAHVPSSQREPSHVSSQGKEAASVTHDIYIYFGLNFGEAIFICPF